MLCECVCLPITMNFVNIKFLSIISQYHQIPFLVFSKAQSGKKSESKGLNKRVTISAGSLSYVRLYYVPVMLFHSSCHYKRPNSLHVCLMQLTHCKYISLGDFTKITLQFGQILLQFQLNIALRHV